MSGRVYSLSCTCHPEEGVRYVGQTVRTLERRLAEHRRAALSGISGAVVHKWMRRHGPENITIELRELLPDGASAEDLNAAEAYWIRYYCAKTPYILNMWTPRKRLPIVSAL